MIASRRIDRRARRLFRLCLTGGRLDPDRVRRVVAHLAGSRQRQRLAVLTRLERLVRLEQQRRSGLVESAVPLPIDLREAMAAALSRRYGEGLTVEFVHNPALIGGTRVTVGSKVFDASIASRLAALGARL